MDDTPPKNTPRPRGSAQLGTTNLGPRYLGDYGDHPPDWLDKNRFKNFKMY